MMGPYLHTTFMMIQNSFQFFLTNKYTSNDTKNQYKQLDAS